MANVDQAFGFRVAGHLIGDARILPQTYTAKTSVEICRGDLLQLEDPGTGPVVDDADTGDDCLLGIACNYISATATDREVSVIALTPGLIVEAQSSGTISEDEAVGKCIDMSTASGTTYATANGNTDGISLQEFDAATVGGTAAQFTVIRKNPDWEWGANEILQAVPNETILGTAAPVGNADA